MGLAHLARKPQSASQALPYRPSVVANLTSHASARIYGERDGIRGAKGRILASRRARGYDRQLDRDAN